MFAWQPLDQVHCWARWTPRARIPSSVHSINSPKGREATSERTPVSQAFSSFRFYYRRVDWHPKELLLSWAWLAWVCPSAAEVQWRWWQISFWARQVGGHKGLMQTHWGNVPPWSSCVTGQSSPGSMLLSVAVHYLPACLNVCTVDRKERITVRDNFVIKFLLRRISKFGSRRPVKWTPMYPLSSPRNHQPLVRPLIPTHTHISCPCRIEYDPRHRIISSVGIFVRKCKKHFEWRACRTHWPITCICGKKSYVCGSNSR